MSTLMVAISTHEGYREYLPKAIESALAVADYVKVYDDGGGCSELVPEGVDYVPIHKTGYCIRARKWAISDAIRLRMDYLLHLDADDWLIRRPPLPDDADMCFSDMYLGNTEGDVSGMWTCDHLARSTDEAWAFLKRTMGTPYGRNPIPGKCCYRVEFLREHGLTWYEWPNTTFGEDVRTIIEYIKHDPRISYVAGQGYYVYRQHGTQDTTSVERRLAFQADIDAFLGAL